MKNLTLADALRGTSHFTPSELACYVRLLDFQWILDGVLPRESTRLAQISGCSESELKSIWPVISSCLGVVENHVIWEATDELEIY